MIKANELRIDNWVKSNINPTAVYVRVTALPLGRQHSEWQIEANYGDYNFEDLEPIPLTAEILEKAGFECNVWFKKDEAKFYESEEMYMLVPHNKYQSYGIAVFADNTFNFGEFHQKVLISATFKYVHQFQNLYFALFGQELEINL